MSANRHYIILRVGTVFTDVYVIQQRRATGVAGLNIVKKICACRLTVGANLTIGPQDGLGVVGV